jgi:YD repeat-containing protein
MGHGIIEGIIEGEQPTQFTYDLNGNTASSNGLSYAYDSSNRLTTVSENDTKLAEYVYNREGRTGWVHV